jgi:ribonucleoside-diphosphate reductase alpha chain
MTYARDPLPTCRNSWTQKATIGGLTVYLTAGEYPDGRLGEIFINVDLNSDETLRALLNAFAIAVSVGLQAGVPLERFVRLFVGFRFGHSGTVRGSEYVKLAGSVLDWAMRELAIYYLGRVDLANVVRAEKTDGD